MMMARYTNLGIALAAVVLCIGLIAFGRGSAAGPGSEFRIDVTIVPSDSGDLDCDSPITLGGLRCAFDDKRRVLDDDRALRPFVSTQGELVLLANLFTAPSVSDWVARARADQRVEVSCRVRRLGTFDAVGVRFKRNSAFEKQSKILAAQGLDCKVRR